VSLVLTIIDFFRGPVRYFLLGHYWATGPHQLDHWATTESPPSFFLELFTKSFFFLIRTETY